ncbi:uncharacterized protein LOC135479393 [Liolophura sinensis]|uniref:uncharacterized protein LOC135479393 n=1 Tax=Liolophura sinensis TaxID=3198878 RepID=UPI0031580374
MKDTRGSLEAPNNSLVSGVQQTGKNFSSRSLEPQGHGDGGVGKQKLSSKHAVLKSPRQAGQNQGALDTAQLVEISQLLQMYRTQDGGSPRGSPSGQLLELLQGLSHRQGNLSPSHSDEKVDHPATSAPGSRMARSVVRRSGDRNKRLASVKQSNLNGATRDVGRSSSVDRASSLRQTQMKKSERKFSAGTSQNRTAVPKWK